MRKVGSEKEKRGEEPSLAIEPQLLRDWAGLESSETGEGAGAGGCVVDDRRRVVESGCGEGEPCWIMNGMVVEVRDFVNVSPDVVALWVEALALGDGVEDAEVWLGVGAGGGGPLPSTVVVGQIAIDEVLHEVLFAEAPIEAEVFGEEHGGDHACPVVHPSGCKELTHGSIDDWVAGAACLPCGKVVGVVIPADVLCVESEWEALADSREVEKDVGVELAPEEFAQPCAGA